MHDHFLVVLSCGTDNPNRATRGLQLAASAAKAGRKTTVFLLDEGVYLAKKGMAANITAATGDKADDHLQFLQEYNVSILACGPCAKSRQISEKDLVEGARLSTANELIEMSFNSAVISL